jgi:hypothetical protein
MTAAGFLATGVVVVVGAVVVVGSVVVVVGFGVEVLPQAASARLAAPSPTQRCQCRPLTCVSLPCLRSMDAAVPGPLARLGW